MANIRIGKISYNDRIGIFEARVDIIRESGTFRYPCALPGPRTMDPAEVEAGLATHARAMSDSPRLR